MAELHGRNNRGFTLVELLVVISIIALLLSILLPSLNKARQLAKKVVCQSNCRQFAIAVMMYHEDYDGYFPYAFNAWETPNPPRIPNPVPRIADVLKKDLGGSEKVWKCPSDRPTPNYPDGMFAKSGTCYNYNSRYANGTETQDGLINMKITQIRQPSTVPMFHEGASFHMPNGHIYTRSYQLSSSEWHIPAMHVVFVDSSTKFSTWWETLECLK